MLSIYIEEEQMQVSMDSHLRQVLEQIQNLDLSRTIMRDLAEALSSEEGRKYFNPEKMASFIKFFSETKEGEDFWMKRFSLYLANNLGVSDSIKVEDKFLEFEIEQGNTSSECVIIDILQMMRL